jgi:hypothetical protein
MQTSSCGRGLNGSFVRGCGEVAEPAVASQNELLFTPLPFTTLYLTIHQLLLFLPISYQAHLKLRPIVMKQIAMSSLSRVVSSPFMCYD